MVRLTAWSVPRSKNFHQLELGLQQHYRRVFVTGEHYLLVMAIRA